MDYPEIREYIWYGQLVAGFIAGMLLFALTRVQVTVVKRIIYTVIIFITAVQCYLCLCLTGNILYGFTLRQPVAVYMLIDGIIVSIATIDMIYLMVRNHEVISLTNVLLVITSIAAGPILGRLIINAA